MLERLVLLLYSNRFGFNGYRPASKASSEVENLIERKNPHILVFGVKEFVCLSVFLIPNLTPIISVLAEQNGLKF